MNKNLMLYSLVLVMLSFSVMAQDTFTLAVNNGAGGGEYTAASEVNIKAEAAPPGKEFDKWVLNVGNPEVDIRKPSPPLIMPAEDVTVTARYKKLPLGDVYQAEDAELSGATVATNNSGFNGSGFVDYQNPTDDYIEWTVDVESAGAYVLYFRYAMASGNRPLELQVNGEVRVEKLSFPETGEWINWVTTSTKQQLAAGENKIRLTANGVSGGNIDELIVVRFLDACDLLTDWNSSGNIKLDTMHYKQGIACLEYEGSTADEFSKLFSTPYVSGLSEAEGVLQFWYFVSDSTLISDIQVELGSGGTAATDAYQWSLAKLTSGWNFISLTINVAAKIGTPNLNAINWFNINSTKSANVVTKIDGIQLLELFIFNLTVVDGSGEGAYEKGETVTITANDASVGKAFEQWIVKEGNPTINNVYAQTTELLMPANDVSVVAKYRDVPDTDHLGAKVPFITYEAEDGVLEGGAIVKALPSTLPEFPTVELESSGRKCIMLKSAGDAVSWTTTEDANAIMVRVSTPDAANGGGLESTLNLYVDDVFVKTIDITSKYAWTYGEWGDGFEHNSPTYGPPRRFYDMFRALIGETVPAGSKVSLKKDADNTADYYIIDLIQLENVAPPLEQPENTLSIEDFGAIANDGMDDSEAYKACISACKSQSKGMWIPQGAFDTKGLISFNGINIYGAGVWYSESFRIVGDASVNYRHKWDLTNCTVQDLYIENRETQRDMEHGHDYGMTVQGSKGWVIRNVWVHRGGACFWVSGTNGLIENCRATESWADGINLNNGSGGINPEKLGLNLTARNNYIIGSGDDGIALNSQNGEGVEGNVANVKIMNNTSICTNWANGMRIAGGRNTLMQNNLITDPSDLSGIRVGEFGSGGNPCESVLVKGNKVIRGSGIRTSPYGRAGITVADGANATFEENEVINSYNYGFEIQNSTATFTNNLVDSSAAEGFYIKGGTVGKGVFTGNNVINLNDNVSQFVNRSQGTFPTTETNNSWQTGVGMDEHLQKNKANECLVYPNPANNTVTILSKHSKGEIYLFDLNGRVVLHKTYNKNNIELDVSAITAGIYILYVNHEKQKLLIE